METKAFQIDLTEVKEFLKQLPTTDELKLLQTGMRTTLETYRSEQNEFVSEFQNHGEIIRR